MLGSIRAAGQAAQQQSGLARQVSNDHQQVNEANQHSAETTNTDGAGRGEKQADSQKFENQSQQALAQNEIKYQEAINNVELAQSAFNGLRSVAGSVTGMVSKIFGR